MKNTLYLLLLFIFISPIFSEEEKFQYNGGFRTRGFMLNRDMIMAANPSATKNTPEKENQQYADTRLNLNGRYNVSKMIDLNVGFQIGDVRFGGANNNVVKQANNPFDPTLIGFNSGGEINKSSGINFQTTFLYANVKQNDWYVRIGLQQFSSPQGRVLFANGTGIMLNKDFISLKQSVQAGYIRGTDKTINDVDGNGFNDNRKPVGINIYYVKWKWYYFRNYKMEAFSYGYENNDSTIEKGHLYWTGIYNEVNFNKLQFTLQPIYQHGVLYKTTNRHYIKSGLLDVGINYSFTSSLTANLFFIGTTGRPGNNLDGNPNYLKGNGYKPLIPLIGTSNIGLDYSGGYSLFSGRTFTGLNTAGIGVSYRTGNFLIVPGYSILNATKSPYIQNNTIYNEKSFYKTSTHLGQELNLNLTYFIDINSKFIIRSGIFRADDGLYALLNTIKGRYMREILVFYEISF